MQRSQPLRNGRQDAAAPTAGVRSPTDTASNDFIALRLPGFFHN